MKLLDVNLLLLLGFVRISTKRTVFPNPLSPATALDLVDGWRAQLYSADADFSRFPGLRWVDPLR